VRGELVAIIALSGAVEVQKNGNAVKAAMIVVTVRQSGFERGKKALHR
jgi:hypothetical protein